MRVHPAPKKRNGAIRYAAGGGVGGRQKKLRRLPHIFSKVLELPFGADADVTVEEDTDGFRFVAATDDLWDDVRAKAIEIHPGVMKVVIRDGTDSPEDDEIDDGALELNRWRFRLPPCTRPSLATAAYVEGELVVVVPKAMGPEEDDGESGGEVDGGIGRLVIVRSCLMFFVGCIIYQQLCANPMSHHLLFLISFLPNMSKEQPRQRHQLTGVQHLQPGYVYSASGERLSCAERDRLVGRDDLGSPHHLVVVETGNLVTAVSGGQVMAQFEIPKRTTTKAADSSAVTIGEALEAATREDAQRVRAAEEREAAAARINEERGP